MNFSKYGKHDWFITVLIFALLSIGGIVIYSATYNTELAYQGAGSAQKQLAFVIIGLGLYFGINLIDINWFKEPKVLFFLYSIVTLLLLYLVFFGETIAETKRWINLGFINIQPSEYAKLVIILITSRILSAKIEFKDINLFRKIKEEKNIVIKFINFLHENQTKLFLILLSGLATLPLVFLVFIQPAFGNSLLIFFLWVSITFIILPSQIKTLFFILSSFLSGIILFGISNLSQFTNITSPTFIGIEAYSFLILMVFYLIAIFIIKLNPKLLILSVLIAIIAVPSIQYSWNNILQEYQRERIETYIEGPQSDRYGAGYQVTQSRIAIGSGQWAGRGFLQGSQSSLKVLDFAYTDFIFAATAEQFGFIGSTALLSIFFFLLVRIIMIASQLEDLFSKLLCIGVATMILLNVFINVGMNIGILPVTGVPLPLVSYGGNSILVNLIGLGLVQAVYSQVHTEDISEKFY